MKLSHLKDPDATICVVEPDDGFMIGWMNKGVYQNAESCVLLTFTAGPKRSRNELEIAIPERAWPYFVKYISDKSFQEQVEILVVPEIIKNKSMLGGSNANGCS